MHYNTPSPTPHPALGKNRKLKFLRGGVRKLLVLMQSLELRKQNF